MDIAKKYEGKTANELAKLFFEIGNAHLVPELRKHIVIALDKFVKMQENDEELYEMIVVADLENHLFAFATGDGRGLKNKDSSNVFYIAQSPEFNECMDMITYICHGNHPEGHLSLASEVYHWIGDAMPEEVEGMDIRIYGGYYYGRSEVDPLYEP